MPIQFVNNIFQAVQIVLGLSQFTLGFLTTRLIFQYSCSLFKNSTPLLWLTVKDLFYLTLGNNRERIPSKPSVHKEIMNITQTNLFTIYLVLTITTAINMTLYSNLLSCILDKLVAIIKNHYYRRIIKGLACFCPGKNNIRHLTATQTLNTGFSQSPAQTFCNIGLT